MLLMSLCKQAYQIVAALRLTAVAARARTSRGLQAANTFSLMLDFAGSTDCANVLACQVWLEAFTNLSLTIRMPIACLPSVFL